ncbi:MAG TPA: HEAT repeat domain-containing protein, partial [Thermodesulfovibrionia bacterium]|nr:HEAT repeat domain-containing protein [Thermodesulfovibrionia bacterium]
ILKKIVGLLRRDEYRNVAAVKAAVEAIVEALINFKDKVDTEVVREILFLLKDDNFIICDKFVGHPAVFLLRKFKEIVDTDVLMEIVNLLDNENDGVQQRATEVISEFKDRVDKEILKKIISLLKDKNSSVRYNAIELLKNFKEKLDDTMIKELSHLIKDKDVKVRHDVILTLFVLLVNKIDDKVVRDSIIWKIGNRLLIDNTDIKRTAYDALKFLYDSGFSLTPGNYFKRLLWQLPINLINFNLAKEADLK